MKKWIHGKKDSANVLNDLIIDEIVSITLVDDIADFRPRDKVIYASKEKDFVLNLMSLTHDQLMKLPEEERDKIDDIDVLRKFDYSELNPAQQLKVSRANRSKLTNIPKKQVKDILSKLKACHIFHVDGTDKNETFAESIYQRGGVMQDTDARKIIHRLDISDYKYGTRSDQDRNWCDLLLVFRFKGSYTFDSYEEGRQPVTVGDLDLYIKIDVEKNQELAEALRVKGLPTLIIYKDGEMKWRQSGEQDANTLIEIVQDYI